jgi:cytochrome c oxidase subunit 2
MKVSKLRATPIALFTALLTGIAALAASGSAHAIAWYFQTPASKMAAEIDWLHQVVMWIILVIFVGVFGFMFYACFNHRRSAGHKAEQFHENTTVEILWTVIPALILIVIAWPVTKTVIAQKDTSAPDLTIKVTGYQWKWGYDYLKGEGEGISFISTLATPREQIEGRAPKGENYLLEVDNEVVVPVGKKVRVITTAADVIHSWWIPALGAKQDAIPGFLRDIWFRAEQTGTFRGQCVELCGKEHGFMPIVVRVVSQDEYSTWVGERKKLMAAVADDPNKKWEAKDLVARGERIYASTCVACHQAQGQGTPAMKAPALAGNKFVTGAEQGPIDTVLNGRPNTAMQAFKATLSVGYRDCRGHHLRAQFVGQQGERCAAGRSEGAAQIETGKGNAT